MFLFVSQLLAWNAVKADVIYDNSKGSPLIPLIQSATKLIDIEIYEMSDANIELALRNAISRGVKVRIIHEPIPGGAACHVFQAPTANDSVDCAREKKMVKYVNAHGGMYIPFSKELCGGDKEHCLNHSKMVIADRKTALISTGNFNSTNLCDHDANPANCNRDYSYLTQDLQVLRSLVTIFENDLLGKAYDVAQVLMKTGNQRLTVSPDSMEPTIKFIQNAKSSIQIQTQYLKDPTMNQALIDAANRGVKVYVMTESACGFGSVKASDAAKWEETYSAFDAAGIKSRIFTKQIRVGGLPGYLHSKAIIVDGMYGWMGSTNGSTQSLTLNREFGIFFDDYNLLKGLYDQMTADYVDEGAESWQQSLNCTKDR